MALTLIIETGAGLSAANAYADVVDGDAYHAGHLYASAWTGATAEQKAMALVMASRLLDAEYRFAGTRANAVQALQWPRVDCPDPDTGDTVPENTVPKGLVEATCELARELLIADRTAAPPGEGQKYYNNGSVQTGYDKADTRPIIPKLVQAMLAKFGAMTKAKSGAVKLIRT
jgi:hypothetical protein